VRTFSNRTNRESNRPGLDEMVYFFQMNKTKTVRFNTYNTRRNLPPETGLKRGEANFLGAFERHVTTNLFKTGYGGRNFALSNYGIADFVWLLPPSQKQKSKDCVLYAFEMKISNWRRAFQQAYRYSYYSDAAFVVLPSGKGSPALANLDLFKMHRIGLWLFDRNKSKVEKVFTPEQYTARNPIARDKAIQKISTSIKLS
jgi:hypothetical protein